MLGKEDLGGNRFVTFGYRVWRVLCSGVSDHQLLPVLCELVGVSWSVAFHFHHAFIIAGRSFRWITQQIGVNNFLYPPDASFLSISTIMIKIFFFHYRKIACGDTFYFVVL